MQQAMFNRFGTPSKVIECVDAGPLKPPSDWEVTIDIMATPVNPSDVSILRGQYGKLPSRFPATTGLEASARVVEAGSRVDTFKPGDRVIVLSNNNWAQRRNVPATGLHKIPDWLSYEQASMVKVNAICALVMLNRFGADLQRGDYIVQNAPLSAVGRMVSVVARDAGYKTVNLVRGEQSLAEIKTRDGDLAIVDDEHAAAMVANATDSAPIGLGLDAVAGDATSRIADCLEVGAPLVNYGMLSGQACQLRADQTIFRDIRLRGFWLLKTLGAMTVAERAQLFDQALGIIGKHKIEFSVYQRYPLEQIADAIEASETHARRGKVLLLPNGEL